MSEKNGFGKEIYVQIDISHIPGNMRKPTAAEDRAEKEAVDNFNRSEMKYPTDIPILPETGDDFLLRLPSAEKEDFVIEREVALRRFFYEPGRTTIVLDLT